MCLAERLGILDKQNLLTEFNSLVLFRNKRMEELVMSVKINTNDSRVIQAEASGELALEDFEYMMKEWKFRMKNKESVRCIVFLDHVKMPPASFFKADLDMAEKYGHKIDRFAVVGDSEWEKKWCHFMRLFAGVEGRYFDRSQKSAAEQWIRAGLKKAG